ncbi:MAG: Holliday junction resolvase RuvX [Planctomycetes bacterium]|nr:Holliday junction resolvase RuvX [Planctomycetota bacterium]
MIGRVGAVDYGRRRVGLAVSDALGITVRGLPTLVRPDDEAAAVAATAAALRAEQVVRVVVGLPLHADGRPSEMSAEARRFGDALGRALGLEVVYVDEGLTSWEAEQDLRAAGKDLRRAQQSGAVDQAAAKALLRGYLRERDARPAEPAGPATPGDRPPDDAPPEDEG